MQGKVNPSGDDVFFLLQSFNTDRTEIAPWSYVIRVDFYQYRVSLYRAFSHCHRFPIRLLKCLLSVFVCRESEIDGGYHDTGELLSDPKGPMSEMEENINNAVAWYKKQLPDLFNHPFLLNEPTAWRLTAWGVVLRNKGHERPHIHPNGWLSGVLYVQLPKIISDPEAQPKGWLEFGRPTKDLHVTTGPKTQAYQPQYGNIILFPSYFYHGTISLGSPEKASAFPSTPSPFTNRLF